MIHPGASMVCFSCWRMLPQGGSSSGALQYAEADHCDMQAERCTGVQMAHPAPQSKAAMHSRSGHGVGQAGGRPDLHRHHHIVKSPACACSVQEYAIDCSRLRTGRKHQSVSYRARACSLQNHVERQSSELPFRGVEGDKADLGHSRHPGSSPARGRHPSRTRPCSLCAHVPPGWV